jgi:hypothetical protein
MKVVHKEMELRVVSAKVGVPGFVTFYLTEEEKNLGLKNGIISKPKKGETNKI